MQSAPTRAAGLTLGWHGRREPEQQRCPRAGDAPPLPSPARAPGCRAAPPHSPTAPAPLSCHPSRPPPRGQSGPCNPGLAIAKEPARPQPRFRCPRRRPPRRSAPAATGDGLPLPSHNPREPPQRRATITAAATAETLRRGLRARRRRQQEAWRGAQRPGPAQAPPRAPRTLPPLPPYPPPPRRPCRAHRARAREVARESEPVGRSRAGPAPRVVPLLRLGSRGQPCKVTEPRERARPPCPCKASGKAGPAQAALREPARLPYRCHCALPTLQGGGNRSRPENAHGRPFLP